MNQLRRLWRLGQFVRREGGIKGTAKLAKAAPKYLALYRRLLADPRVPKSAKAALLGAAGFAVSPLNLPGFIPFIGALDDLAILALANGYFMKQISADVLAEHRAAAGLGDDLP